MSTVLFLNMSYSLFILLLSLFIYFFLNLFLFRILRQSEKYLNVYFPTIRVV